MIKSWQKWKQRQRENHTWIYDMKLKFFEPRKYKKYMHIFMLAYNSQVKFAMDTFKKYGQKVNPMETATYLEIGAGWRLVSLIGVSLSGMKSVIGIDIENMLSVSDVRRTIYLYRKYGKKLDLKKIPKLPGLNMTNVVTVLNQKFNIDYRAPYDIAKIPAQSVNYLASFITFEHIPKDDIIKLLNNSYRAMVKGGIFVVSIDYQDHVSFTRETGGGGYSNITNPYHFLQYTEDEWQGINQIAAGYDNFYQNRLRTPDYVQMFKDAGFKILEIQSMTPKPDAAEKLAAIKIAPCFEKYSQEDLMCPGCNFVLIKEYVS